MSFINEGIETMLRNGAVELIIFGLIFAIVFGVLRKIRLFAGGKKDDKDKLDKVKPIHMILSLSVAIISIIPHHNRAYSKYDIVPIVEQFLPKVSFIVLAMLSILIVLGVLGIGFRTSKEGDGNPLQFFLILGLIGMLVWVFGSTAGWGFRLPYWFTSEVMAAVFALLAFGIIISIVMGPDKKKDMDFKKLEAALGGEGKIDWDKVENTAKLKSLFKNLK